MNPHTALRTNTIKHAECVEERYERGELGCACIFRLVDSVRAENGYSYDVILGKSFSLFLWLFSLSGVLGYIDVVNYRRYASPTTRACLRHDQTCGCTGIAVVAVAGRVRYIHLVGVYFRSI